MAGTFLTHGILLFGLYGLEEKAGLTIMDNLKL
jgi:hypothetical protein